MAKENAFVEPPTELQGSIPLPSKSPVSRLPPSWQPFAQLMRLDRLHAAVYFVIPVLLGSLQAARLSPVTLHDFLHSSTLLSLWIFFFRGATNAWNDILDVEFDRQVARTKNRPLARGAITVREAVIFTSGLVAICILISTLLPAVGQICAIVWLITGFLYPLSKRCTHFPQLIFGFIMSWGVFVGAATTWVYPNGESPQTIAELESLLYKLTAQLLHDDLPNACRAVLGLYLAHVAWSTCYETIYSYMDVKDDKGAGVKNIALLMPRRGKILLFALAATAIVMLRIVGYYSNASLPFYAFEILGAGCALTLEIYMVDLSEPKSCQRWFAIGGLTTGLFLVTGLSIDIFISRLIES